MRHFTEPFPVSDDFFAPLILSQQRLNGLRTQVSTALNNALVEWSKYQNSADNPRTKSCFRWKMQAEHEELSAYARIHELAPTVRSSRVSGSIQGNYLDIARILKSETRDQYFTVQKRLYPDVVDAAVLHVVPQCTVHESASEGVKWAAYSTRWRRKLVDGCVFDSTGTGVGSDGRPYFYYVVIPTELAELRNLSTTEPVAHAQCRSVLILSPSAHDDSRSEVFMAMRSDLKCRRTSRTFYKRLLTGLCNLAAISFNPHTPSFEFHNGTWVDSDPQRSCHFCSRSFSVLWPRHKCSLCGQVICRHCVAQGDSSRRWSRLSNSTRTKLCKACHGHFQGDPHLFWLLEAPTPTSTTHSKPHYPPSPQSRQQDDILGEQSGIPYISVLSPSSDQSEWPFDQANDREIALHGDEDSHRDISPLTADMIESELNQDGRGKPSPPTHSIYSSLREPSKLVQELRYAVGSYTKRQNAWDI